MGPGRPNYGSHSQDMMHRQHRLDSAQQLAASFCKATLEKTGTHDAALKPILQQVHRLGIQQEFQAAVVIEAQRHGRKVKGAADIIEREFGGNPLERFFKNAPRKEHLDYLVHGHNRYRATPWEYRLYGMYRSLADFLFVCKKHPVMSAGVIGSVAWLGHRYPFLGAISGVAILAWSAVFSLKHELQALESPAMNSRKAEHYQNSGENMAAFLITALGAKGIHEGTVNGFKQGSIAFKTAPNKTALQGIQAGLKSTWVAIKSTLPQENKMSPVEAFLFVSGLFDNVLLPFNWLADKMKRQ